MAFSKITDEQIAELRSRIGKPVTRVTEPFYREVNVDAARNYAHAIGDNNPLWLDREYGARTRWGGQLAPPTVLYSTENTVSGAVEGLAGVHAMFAGTDWRWFEPIRVGTVMRTVSTLKDMVAGLNALGVGPRDLITILQTIKAAGALQADIEAR